MTRHPNRTTKESNSVHRTDAGQLRAMVMIAELTQTTISQLLTVRQFVNDQICWPASSRNQDQQHQLLVAKTAMQVDGRNSSCPDGESFPDRVSAALGYIEQVGERHLRQKQGISQASTTPPLPHMRFSFRQLNQLDFLLFSLRPQKSFQYHPLTTNLSSFKMSSTEQT